MRSCVLCVLCVLCALCALCALCVPAIPAVWACACAVCLRAQPPCSKDTLASGAWSEGRERAIGEGAPGLVEFKLSVYFLPACCPGEGRTVPRVLALSTGLANWYTKELARARRRALHLVARKRDPRRRHEMAGVCLRAWGRAQVLRCTRAVIAGRCPPPVDVGVGRRPRALGGVVFAIGGNGTCTRPLTVPPPRAHPCPRATSRAPFPMRRLRFTACAHLWIEP
jgi:hypothetical protein